MCVVSCFPFSFEMYAVSQAGRGRSSLLRSYLYIFIHIHLLLILINGWWLVFLPCHTISGWLHFCALCICELSFFSTLFLSFFFCFCISVQFVAYVMVKLNLISNHIAVGITCAQCYTVQLCKYRYISSMDGICLFSLSIALVCQRDEYKWFGITWHSPKRAIAVIVRKRRL